MILQTDESLQISSIAAAQSYRRFKMSLVLKMLDEYKNSLSKIVTKDTIGNHDLFFTSNVDSFEK